MWMLRTAIVAMFLTGGLAIGASAPAQADEMTWTLTSKYQYKVQVSFYSRTRNHEWPGNDKAWGLDDYGTHRFTLSCNAGEKICYGAWATGDSTTYWGVGLNGKNGCTSCCAICGEEDPVKTLTQ
jgi:hypothetical protein